MSERGREFFRTWVSEKLDQNARPETNVSNMLMEAIDHDISQEEIEEAIGNLVSAMMAAMSNVHRT